MLLIDHNIALVMDALRPDPGVDQGQTLAEGTPDGDPSATSTWPRLRRDDRAVTPTMADPALELAGLEIRYGAVARRARCQPARRAGRDRRPDRAERRRQVDDAARHHRSRPGSRRRRAPGRPLHPRPLSSRRSRTTVSRSSLKGGGSLPTSASRRTSGWGSPPAAVATAVEPSPRRTSSSPSCRSSAAARRLRRECHSRHNLDAARGDRRFRLRLVHRQHTTGRVAPRVMNSGGVEQPLHSAVLTECAVQS